MVSFLSAALGWALTGAQDDGLSVTSDGGQTWTVLSTGSRFRGVQSLEFVTPQVGWALAGNADSASVIKTTDAGHTWTAVP